MKEGLKTRKHERKGWLEDMLLEEGEITVEKYSLWRRVLRDYKCQLSGIEGMKIVDPRKHIGTPGVAGDFVSQKRPTDRQRHTSQPLQTHHPLPPLQDHHHHRMMMPVVQVSYVLAQPLLCKGHTSSPPPALTSLCSPSPAGLLGLSSCHWLYSSRT